MNDDNKTFGSLFSGGGGLDLGLEQAGLKCVFQVENDTDCLTILNRHWPDVPKNQIRSCVGLVGGDPCPIRSTASAMQGTTKPDMSGYFLAMVARCKPRWVLRENVPAPDIVEFESALGSLGYYSTICTANSKSFTGQSRNREFVAGFDRLQILNRFIGACLDAESHQRVSQASSGNQTSLLGLTTRRFRLDPRQNYVYEGAERGLRVLSHAERESLQGWPVGWTDGVSDSARERIVGNGVTAPVAKWLGERIVEALDSTDA
jgi:DNA (cytosine-5)-methyltransferase 1